jgi:hypothetical protein
MEPSSAHSAFRMALEESSFAFGGEKDNEDAIRSFTGDAIKTMWFVASKRKLRPHAVATHHATLRR